MENMTFNNQMKLPGSYFANMAKRDYRNWNEALIRELTQNSVDAKATEISIYWDEESRTLHFNDNGTGMTQDILENAFLQFGASHKAEGAVGGMGKAKELIIASWPSWKIHTNGLKAQGRHNEYNLSACDYVKGTTIILTLTDDIYMNEELIKKFFSKCQISSRIFINGESYTGSSIRKAKVAQIEDFGKLYKGSQGDAVCYVRANGVFMFSEYIESNEGFIFEISNSAGCMSAGRDGFVNDYYRKYSALVRQMNFNSSSLKEYKAEIDVMVSENMEDGESEEKNIEISSSVTVDAHSNFIGAMNEAIQSTKSITPIKFVPKAEWKIDNMSQDEMNSDRGREIIRGLHKRTKLDEAGLFGEKTSFYSKYLHGRFLFRTTDLSKGSQKYMITVKSAMINFLFFGVVKEVAKIMSDKVNVQKNFVVGGFVDHDSDQEAVLSDGKILLNLEKISEYNFDEKLLIKLISLSCHEVIHFDETHNERMANLLTDFLPLMLTEQYGRFKEIFKKVKQMKPVFQQEINRISVEFPERKRKYDRMKRGQVKYFVGYKSDNPNGI